MAINIFGGWVSATSESLDNSAVTGQVIENQSAYFKQGIKVCRNREEVHDALEIDTSAGATYDAFSAELKARYVRSLDMTSNTVVVILRLVKASTAHIENQDTGVRLKDGVVGDAFFETYGDSYISSVTTGLETVVSYVFKAMTLDEKEDVMASLSGSGVVAGAKINASAKTSINKATSSSNVAWELKQQTFGRRNPPVVTADTIESFAKDEFMDLVPDSAHVVSFKVTPYRRLLETSPERDNVTRNLDALVGTGGAPGWAAKLTRLQAVKSQIKQVKAIYDVYQYPGDKELQNRLDTVNKSIAEISGFMTELGRNPAVVTDFPEPPPEAYENPQVRYVLNSGPVFGLDSTDINYGMQGEVNGKTQPFRNEDVRKGVRITSIRLDRGDWIDGITVTYQETLNGNKDARPRRTLIHGRQSTLAMTFPLGEDELITSMHGVGGKGVDALEFTTSYGRKKQGGKFQNGNRITDWAGGPDEALLGFHGWCGNYLDTVRPVIAKFMPASWKKWDA